MTYFRQKVLRDGSLTLSVDESLRAATADWMPSLPATREDSHPDGPGIRVDVMRTSSGERRREKPALSLGSVSAWVDEAFNAAYATSSGGHLECRVDLNRRVAHVSVRDDAAPDDVASALTIVSALLLVQDGRTLVRAAALVEPDTQAVWLLAGDSDSGRSTATANLAESGWTCVSDDFVVISPNQLDSVSVVDWGLLGGILFPRPVSGATSGIEPLDPAVALERLIAQTPWLVDDAASAPPVLRLLKLAAASPVAELAVGKDAHRGGSGLALLISDFAERARSAPAMQSGEPGED